MNPWTPLWLKIFAYVSPLSAISISDFLKFYFIPLKVNVLASKNIKGYATSLVIACMYAQSCLTLLQPHGLACQAPLSMGFSSQEYWSGLPFPAPGVLPDPGGNAKQNYNEMPPHTH